MDDRTWLGNLAEIRVAAELLRERYEVFVGWGGKTSCDLIALKDGVLHRVQVKGTRTRSIGPKGTVGGYTVQLRSVRSNKTANVVKTFDAGVCDLLGIYIEPEDRVVILKAKGYHGRNTVNIKANTGRVSRPLPD